MYKYLENHLNIKSMAISTCGMFDYPQINCILANINNNYFNHKKHNPNHMVDNYN